LLISFLVQVLCVASVLCSFFDQLVTGKQVQNSVGGLTVLQLRTIFINKSINVRVDVGNRIDRKDVYAALELKQKALNIVVNFVHVAFERILHLLLISV